MCINYGHAQHHVTQHLSRLGKCNWLPAAAAECSGEFDAKRKHLLLSPEYILSVMQQKSGSQERKLIRVIHFHRDDLLPYEQQLYDEQGNLETEVLYGSYQDFGGSKYPKTVTIKRPFDGFQIVLTVDSVKENVELKDSQFHIQIPAEVKIQTLQ